MLPPLGNRRGLAMTKIDRAPRRLVLKSGSTTITLDKDTGKATFERKVLMFAKKPVEAALADVAAVTVDAAVDRASGVEVANTMLVTRAGAGWALPAADKKDADAAAAAIREFLGLKG
jgi:hypothetical protein